MDVVACVRRILLGSIPACIRYRVALEQYYIVFSEFHNAGVYSLFFNLMQIDMHPERARQKNGTPSGRMVWLLGRLPRAMHSKVIVVDNKTTIVGSANWSDSALLRNDETSVLIRSSSLSLETCR